MELYAEWARNDHSWDTRDLALDPTHASGSVIGMQKVFMSREGFFRLGMESVTVPAPLPHAPREGPTFYTHEQITQGYTQDGRLIGASVGPVGSGEYLRFDAFRPWGRMGGEFSVVEHPGLGPGPTSISARPALTLCGSRILCHW